ncbi:hypothetical protein [Hydrogenophaga sp.]|uniref:hypothetical protein n=1 Tax=Hydrogenophaga sp. TaxID=1904254 RepID=UPI00286DB4F2|nr:hypothetical protein [Hydrogenophaga sp.]
MFSLLMGLSISSSWADIRESRSQLAAYGTAYCMSRLGAGPIKVEADMAMNGYFQLSSYESEDAYRAVRRHIDQAVPNPIPVYQTTGKAAVLMVCLGLGQHPDFLKLVRQQDRHLPNRTTKRR